MKHSLYAIIAFVLFISAAGSMAQERPFGLGLILGEPTGVSAKLWLSPVNAFDFGLGWSTWGTGIDNNIGSSVHFHMDYLWHWFDAIHSSERFPLYAGIGGQINANSNDNSSVAVRGVFGIEWLPHNSPVDVFLELVPLLQVVPSSGFGVNAGLGARYYF
jgi:hypothetical protein